MNCTVGSTRLYINATDTCLCSPPYHGKRCELPLDWWFPTQQGIHIVQSSVYVLLFIWTIIIMVSKARRGRVWNLSGGALILQMISIVARFIWIWMEKKETVPFFVSPTPAYAFVTAAFSSLPYCVEFAAGAIVMAFWIEVWTRKMKGGRRKGMAKKTKILLICASVALFVITTVGIGMANPILNFVLIFLPVLLMTVLLLVLTIIIRRFNTEGFSKVVKSKHRWASTVFVVFVTTCVLFCATLGTFVAILFAAPGPIVMFCYALFPAIEISFEICLALLIDTHGQILIRSLKAAVHCRVVKEDEASRTTSSNVGSSKSKSKPSSSIDTKSSSVQSSDTIGSDM